MLSQLLNEARCGSKEAKVRRDTSLKHITHHTTWMRIIDDDEGGEWRHGGGPVSSYYRLPPIEGRLKMPEQEEGREGKRASEQTEDEP